VEQKAANPVSTQKVGCFAGSFLNPAATNQFDDAGLSLKPEVMLMNAISRADIRPGAHVRIVQKNDQRSGKMTEGIVRDILTKASNHPHGIKVRLESGIVGRVKELLPQG
jgi:uncharacterized repeat protein (TIGR03833 family)